MFQINIPGYYNRFESQPQYKEYKQLLFRAGDILQSAEVNELQTTLKNDFSNFSTKFVKNGDFINGGEINVEKIYTGNDNELGFEIFDWVITCNSGELFFDGEFISVPHQEFTVYGKTESEMNEEFGVVVKSETISPLDDSSLLEPANNIRNFGQPGAWRLKITGVWAMNSELQLNDGEEFVRNFSIISGKLLGGVIVEDEFTKNTIEVIAEYDRESRGNYLVYGFEPRFISKQGNLGEFKFQISSGKANIFGYKYFKRYSTEYDIPQLVDFELHQGEPCVFNRGSGFYELNHSPIRKVFRVSGEKNIQTAITHGSYSGAVDTFPSEYTPVVRIKKVFQGTTVFVEGRDYTQSGDSISWALSFDDSLEPAPNSTYYVEWDYRETQVSSVGFQGNNGDISEDLTSIWLEGYNDGSVVSIDYDFILERIDVVALDSLGEFITIKGVPREFDPRPPIYDKEKFLSLFEVRLSGNEDPTAKSNGQRVFKMEDIEKLYTDIRDSQYNISLIGLKLDLKGRGKGLKDSFIDPFLDDGFRDVGLEEVAGYSKAFSVGGVLSLNINWETFPVVANTQQYGSIISLGKTSSFKILEQPHYTGTMQITGLFFRDPPRATLKITPSTYSWIDRDIFLSQVEMQETTTLTRTTFGAGSEVREILGEVGRSRTSEITVNEVPSIIPEIPLRLTSEDGDFNDNESVDVLWNGEHLITINADSNGKIDSTFNVPENEISGKKVIETIGTVSGVNGSVNFLAIPLTRTITETVTVAWRWIKTIHVNPPPPVRRDPLAQTFSINETKAIDYVRVFFETAPTSEVFFELVETTAGLPDASKKLFIKKYPSSDFQDNSGFNFVVDSNIVLKAGKEYAFVIGCQDPNATLKIAKLGERSINTGIWLTSQAYELGVLLNSSNNETWSPIQDSDLMFELHCCDFETERVVEFDPVTVAGMTDFELISIYELEENTKIEFELELVDEGNKIIKVEPNTYERLDTEYSGVVIPRAILKSDGRLTPHINVDAQLVVGKVDLQSMYTSVSFPFDVNDSKILVYIDRLTEGSSSYKVELQIKESGVLVWKQINVNSSAMIGDNWFEDYYEVDVSSLGADVDQYLSKIRITLEANGNEERVFLKNLRLNKVS